MSTSVNLSFIKDFESEVHTAYQRQGSLLRGTVRTTNSVVGASTTFQKVGKGAAQQKSRHGKVPTMNIDHTPVECTLVDYYAGDWCDKLDELKINIDEKMVTAQAGAYALGRTTDTLITTALDEVTTNTASINLTQITKATPIGMLTALGARDIKADDGQLYAAVSWAVWGVLLGFAEFTSADYVDIGGQQFKTGVRPKSWLGVTWIPHSGLPGAASARKCYMYHRNAIGHAIGSDVQTDITWHGDHAAHFINNMMSQGACLIDNDGVQELIVNEGA